MNLAEISLGGIVENLISSVIIGLIIGGITIAVIKDQLRRLTSRVELMEGRERTRDQAIAAARQERTECELRAAHNYASRGDIARLIADAAGSQQAVLTRLDEMDSRQADRIEQVHGRVTDAVGKIENMRGRMAALEKHNGAQPRGPA